MKVRVLFFASLREAVGAESLEVELNGASFAELKLALDEHLEDRSEVLWADNVRLARNQELLEIDPDSLAFVDGDELAFLPPVTGG